MSITDELKEYAEGCYGGSRTRLKAIADRIDEGHERALTEQFKSLTIDMEPMTEENMAEGGWVRLPVDADGVPIHIGDRLVEPEYVPNGGTVVGIKLYTGWNHWLVNCGAWVDPRKCRHHHEPTVEDVLREFGNRVCKSGHQWGLDAADTITEYAEKLREVVKHECD